jgi:twitching motility protein PilJ
VTTINESAILVDGAAKQTEGSARQLAAASEAQSKQIESASRAISRMASSIEEVAGNAERSSDVARHSVDVAHKGGDAVRRTIEGMNAIRETIQETSKRIKRLGESSQEIGNIVELINDIADQTNILALNAAIQASMAGEAGRGFAVVADEVQRLAERSANATKQIEFLVRTIQADTNEAIVSMERSTTDVVGGALLAENAGAALEEIEQVSNQIAALVQNISSSAREQGKAAGAVTRSMDVLQEINSETAANTSATTSAISKLAELATQLRRSVAGFRLPPVTSATPRSAVSGLTGQFKALSGEVEVFDPGVPDEPSAVAPGEAVEPHARTVRYDEPVSFVSKRTA